MHFVGEMVDAHAAAREVHAVDDELRFAGRELDILERGGLLLRDLRDRGLGGVALADDRLRRDIDARDELAVDRGEPAVRAHVTLHHGAEHRHAAVYLLVAHVPVAVLVLLDAEQFQLTRRIVDAEQAAVLGEEGRDFLGGRTTRRNLRQEVAADVGTDRADAPGRGIAGDRDVACGRSRQDPGEPLGRSIRTGTHFRHLGGPRLGRGRLDGFVDLRICIPVDQPGCRHHQEGDCHRDARDDVQCAL